MDLHFYVANCERVIDGDTIEVIIDLGFGVYKNETIRLLGVDTPELNSQIPLEVEAAKIAKNRLSELLLDRDIFISTDKLHKDKYYRYGAFIYLEKNSEISVNDMIIRSGLGRYYNGGTRLPWEQTTIQKIVNEAPSILTK